MTRKILVALFVVAFAIHSMPAAHASVLSDLLAWIGFDSADSGDTGAVAHPNGGPGDGEGDAD